MRYHYEKPSVYASIFGKTYECDHPVYNKCTLYLIDKNGLAVIQQRYDETTKHTYWTEIDPWLTDLLYTHPSFKSYFDERASEPTDSLDTTNNVGFENQTTFKRTMGDLFR